MAYRWLRNSKALVIVPLLLLLGLVVACGDDETPVPTQPQPTAAPTAAPTAVPTAAPTAVPTAAPTAVPTAAPTAVPTAAPTAMPTAMVPAAPSGTLRVIVEEFGRAAWSPETQTAGMTSVSDTTFAEAPWHNSVDGELTGLLVESWSISDDGTEWTLNLQQGIPFHFDYGEFTADDLIFNMTNSQIEGTTVGRGPVIRRNWHAEGGGMTKIDDHTVVVDTVIPQYDFTWQSTTGAEAGYGMGQLSKAYYDTVGKERAPFDQAVGTGPWRSREFGGGVWKFDAVLDHWRKVPNFVELDYREILEESTRLANFLSGQADIVALGLESVASVRADDPNTEVLQFATGGQVFLLVHGNQYVDQPWVGARDCTVAFLSCNPDMNSEEWENARKVREAMNISIDRDLLVETILDGNGTASHHYGWTGFQSEYGDIADLTYDFDTARARQLIAEAGYPDGFDIEFSLTPRPYPGVIDAGLAVSVMWEEVGINVTQQSLTFSAFRHHGPGRSYTGVNSHATAIGPEPASRFISCLWRSCDGFSYGWAHATTDPLVEDIIGAFERPERMQAVRDMSRVLFEQNAVIPLMNVALVWPISDKVEPWDWWCCIPSYPTRLEFVEHR